MFQRIEPPLILDQIWAQNSSGGGSGDSGGFLSILITMPVNDKNKG